MKRAIDTIMGGARVVASFYRDGRRFEVATADDPDRGRRILAYWLEHVPGEGWIPPTLPAWFIDSGDGFHGRRIADLAGWLEEAAGPGPLAPIVWQGWQGIVADSTGSGAAVARFRPRLQPRGGRAWGHFDVGQLGPTELAPGIDVSPEVARGVALAIRQVRQGVHVLDAEVLEGDSDAQAMVQALFGCTGQRDLNVTAGTLRIACATCGTVGQVKVSTGRHGLSARFVCPRGCSHFWRTTKERGTKAPKTPDAGAQAPRRSST